MSMLLDRLRHRAGATARRSSAGSVVPGGPVPTGAGGSAARKRMTMRRRLRRLRQMREALLVDLGALVYEMHRQDRRELHLLERKTEELAAVDEEARALAAALDADGTLAELEMAGIAGSCVFCGAIVSVDSSFCSSCGAPAVSALGGEDAGSGAAPVGADHGRAQAGGPEPAPRPGRTSVEPRPGTPGAARPSARAVREGFVRRLAGRRPRS
jgi:hypothetical protein